ncbi:hypothetical protein WJX73_008505 [Symbiochloris irregularis]|uniref:Uncharacterized protein n=1 Tax=Symbiochloris irregularis TaxID=706552 RepID=A0AAW1P6F6_9CHLO
MSSRRARAVLAPLILFVFRGQAQPSETPLKILINPGPVFSHWLPVLKICRELEARGHHTKYLYPGDLDEVADKFHLPSADRIPHSYIVEAGHLSKGVAELKAQGREQEVAKVMLPYFFDYARAAIEDNSSMAAIRDWAPDVLFYDAGFPAGAPVGTLLDIPLVGFHVLGTYGSFYLRQAGSPSAISLTPTFPVPVWVKDPLTIIDRAKCLFSGVIGMLIAQAINKAFTPMWTRNGMPHLTHREGMGKTAAWIFQGDFAMLPAIPMSPHVHLPLQRSTC